MSKSTTRLILVGTCFCIGILTGLGTFAQFTIYFIMVLAFSIIALVFLGFRNLNIKQNKNAIRVLLLSVGSFVICYTIYKTKNHINQQKAERLLISINEYALRHVKYPDNLEELVPDFRAEVPEYFYQYQYYPFKYHLNTEQNKFTIRYSIDGFSENVYDSDSNTWYQSD